MDRLIDHSFEIPGHKGLVIIGLNDFPILHQLIVVTLTQGVEFVADVTNAIQQPEGGQAHLINIRLNTDLIGIENFRSHMEFICTPWLNRLSAGRVAGDAIISQHPLVGVANKNVLWFYIVVIQVQLVQVFQTPKNVRHEANHIRDGHKIARIDAGKD